MQAALSHSRMLSVEVIAGGQPESDSEEPSVSQIGSILVVDYDSALSDLLVDLLTSEGYVVERAVNSAAAITAIIEHAPTLILLDLGRPGTRGDELIAQMRAACLTDVSIVLMTATPRDAERLITSEAITYLAKPFDIDDLLACVARYVRLAQTTDHLVADKLPRIV